MSRTYGIAEVARRSGYPSSTLRYYDEIGLVPAAERTSAGYRRYDDRSLERLAFIDRAKRLGCSLDEISGLVEAWDGGTCGPLQERLRTLVDGKIGEARRQVADLVRLTTDLQRAASALGSYRPDGPCDDACGCASDPPIDAEAPTPVLLVTAGASASDDATIACSLGDPAAISKRTDEWHAVLRHATGRAPIEGGLRLSLSPDAPLGEIARLAAAEQGCCSFFSFAITVDATGAALEVRAPAGAAPIVDALFGSPR